MNVKKKMFLFLESLRDSCFLCDREFFCFWGVGGIYMLCLCNCIGLLYKKFFTVLYLGLVQSFYIRKTLDTQCRVWIMFGIWE